jgi:MFS family permease
MRQAVGRNRSLLILGFAESVSGIGNWITMMAVFALVVFRGAGSVAQSSAIFLAGLLPTLLVSPYAGWLVDRVDRRRLMIASELVSGLCVAGIIFTERLELIYLLLALQAVSMSVMAPARQAAVPDIVGRDRLTQANAFLQQLAGLVKIGAPILAGALLAWLNPHTAIVLDVISFAVAAVILSRLPALPPHRHVSPDEKVSQPAAGAGSTAAAVLRQSPRLRLLFTTMFLSIFVIIGFDILAPVYIRDVLLRDESYFGLMIGLVGLGTVGATLVLMLRKSQGHQWRDILLGLTLLGSIPAGLWLITRLGNPALAGPLAALVAFIGGIGNGLLVVQIGTMLQLLTPAAVLGRISGLFQSTVIAGQLAGILVTPLLVPGVLDIGTYFGLSFLALVGVVLYGGLTADRTAPAAPRVAGADRHAPTE